MALVQTELSEVAPYVPFFGCVLADRWACTWDYRNDNSGAPGNVPRGTVTVLDATTETAQGWKGLSYLNEGCAAGDWIWLITHMTLGGRGVRNLYRLHPGLGTSTSYTIPGLTAQSRPVTVGTQIWIFDRSATGSWVDVQRFDLTTMTWLSSLTTPGGLKGLAYDGTTYVYAFTATGIERYTASTGAKTSLTPTGYSNPDGVDTKLAFGAIWWCVYGELWKYTIATNTCTKIATPGTSGQHVSGGFGLAPDGMLYGAFRGSDTLVIVDPSTGSWGTDTMSPSRGFRSPILVANGQLWSPAGQPYTR